MMPYITVFTPTFNRGRLLNRLYESLKQQTVNDFEWIIVDDGSEDNTVEIIEQFCKDGILNIRFFRQENSGKHVAINVGAKEALGEWFFVVDSDDIITYDAIETIEYYIETIKDNTEFAGVVGLRGDSQMRPWFNWGTEEKKGFDDSHLKFLSRDYIDADSFEYRWKLNIKGDRAEIVKTEILRKYPFPVFEGEKFVSEGVLWTKLACDGYKFRWFNKVIYITEYMNDGLTQNINRVHLNSPNGTAYFCNLQAKINRMPILKRVKCVYRYIKYSKISGKSFREVYVQASCKFFTVIFWLLYSVRRIKWL